MFSRSLDAQCVGRGLEKKVLSAFWRNSWIHGASFLTDEM
jgi:hypothetical protein